MNYKSDMNVATDRLAHILYEMHSDIVMDERVLQVDGMRYQPAPHLWLYVLGLIGCGIVIGEVATRAIWRNQQSKDKDGPDAEHYRSDGNTRT